MKIVSEFFILLIIIISTSFSTIFCLIGFLTPGWNFDTYRHLFCDQCSKTPHIFGIISIIILIICLLLLILFISSIIDQKQIIIMRFIIPLMLFISTICLLTTLSSYLHFIQPNHGYSYYLIMLAFLFAYLASLVAVFWLGNGSFMSKSYSLQLNS